MKQTQSQLDAEVINFITLIVKTFGHYEDMSGGCLKFHYILKKVFPTAIGYYDSDHIVTKIGKHYFDINGRNKEIKRYLPFSDFGEENIINAAKQYL